MSKESEVKTMRPAGHLSGGQVLAGLAVGIGTIWYLAAGGSGSADTHESKVKPSPFTAFVICQGFVKSSLKAPASAQFPPKPLSAIDVGDSTYVVTSTVDSQNSFGAMLRSDWLCRAQHTGGHAGAPGSWKLLDLTIS